MTDIKARIAEIKERTYTWDSRTEWLITQLEASLKREEIAREALNAYETKCKNTTKGTLSFWVSYKARETIQAMDEIK